MNVWIGTGLLMFDVFYTSLRIAFTLNHQFVFTFLTVSFVLHYNFFYLFFMLVMILSLSYQKLRWMIDWKLKKEMFMNLKTTIRVRAALYFILCMLHIVCLTDCAVCNAEFVWYYMLLYLTSPAKKCFYLFLSILKKTLCFMMF